MSLFFFTVFEYSSTAYEGSLDLTKNIHILLPKLQAAIRLSAEISSVSVKDAETQRMNSACCENSTLLGVTTL